MTAGCVGGSTRVHRVSGTLLVARGDKMTAAGPRAWSPRDGARCSVIRGKLADQTGSQDALGQ